MNVIEIQSYLHEHGFRQIGISTNAQTWQISTPPQTVTFEYDEEDVIYYIAAYDWDNEWNQYKSDWDTTQKLNHMFIPNYIKEIGYPEITINLSLFKVSFTELASVYNNDSRCNCIFLVSDFMNYLTIKATTKEILEDFKNSLVDLKILRF